jgi:hypothetical protein
MKRRSGNGRFSSYSNRTVEPGVAQADAHPMPTFIDHVSIPVADFSTSAAFYDAVLATLGMQRRKENDIGIGWGPPETAAPIFWIIAQKPGSASAGLGLHISFRAKDRAEVHSTTALRRRRRRARHPPSIHRRLPAASSSTPTAS